MVASPSCLLAYLVTFAILLSPCLGATTTATVFIAPNPSSTDSCETTSYRYETETASTTYYDLWVYAGTKGALGLCSTALVGIGGLAVGPSQYVLSVPEDSFHTFTGRIESCTVLSAMTNSAGSPTGTVMSCSESQFGTFTNRQTITTSYEVPGTFFTRTSSISRTTETITATAQATWTAALAAQATISRYISSSTSNSSNSSSTRFPTTTIVAIVVAIIVFASVVSGIIRYRRIAQRRKMVALAATSTTVHYATQPPGPRPQHIHQQQQQQEMQARQERELRELRALVQAQEMRNAWAMQNQAQSFHPPAAPVPIQPTPPPSEPSQPKLFHPSNPYYHQTMPHTPLNPQAPVAMPMPEIPLAGPSTMTQKQPHSSSLSPGLGPQYEMKPLLSSSPSSSAPPSPGYSPKSAPAPAPPAPKPNPEPEPPGQPQPPFQDMAALQARIAQLEADLRASGSAQNQGGAADVPPPAYRPYDDGLGDSGAGGR